ncbi:alcohol dehydrogenase catalytic domain-containing protein [Nakamurella sp. YIM 132087]|uniref:alcohol dehydrogenase (NADP(+)) n=1 Tax=Nakamurella alba TaxID=2665158 RepID=A0A7K1FPI3_9ACTN|nr:NAD(P)-dependent alcohol dehydrogenase [Nakamurella alba]MTD14734.1 alcohol dehydrogenase catalytic domain-containing protein [Nakamurella alba]
MRTTTAYRADAPGADLRPTTIERRELRAGDIAVRITHCGVCHTDLHALRSTDSSAFPVVPGHEFVGVVSEIGSDVDTVAIGDPVAVGNIVDSCGECPMCRAGQQNYCDSFPTLTYGGADPETGDRTMGAYSAEYVVRADFAYPLPAGLDPAGVAPLMCAGATVWEPLRHWQTGPGKRVGIIGLGGLGHLAVKFAAALGAEVTVFTTSSAKEQDARSLGAEAVVVSTDAEAMRSARGSLDLIIDTVSADHDLGPYLRTLALDGTLCHLGDLGPVGVDTMDLLIGRKSLSSSGSAGLPATREMLDFCGEHGITADVEVLPSAQVMTALDRLAKGDVRYRFVLDMSDL